MSFNINAKVVLSGPERLDKIRNSIKKKLGNLNVPLTIDVGKGTQSALSNLNSQTQALQKSMAALQAATKNVNNSYNKYNKSSKGASTSNKNLAQATNAVSNSFDRTAKSAQQAGSQVEKFGKDAALAIRRFSAFTLATGAVFGFVQSVRTGISESIAFERELSRITQVTGKTGDSIKKLGSNIQGLAASFGVSKNEIAEVAVILAQTGRGIEDIQKSLKPLVKTKLGPTFKDLKSTTEGLVAAQAQFGIQSKDTGRILDSLNAIAKRFAVESDDLVSVIRRAGGVFAEANKNARLFAQGSGVVRSSVDDQIQSFNELLGIFTSVRSQTRETADTISTGLRTIFSRLQRPTTIKFLEQYGVQLKVTEQDVKDFQNTAKGDLISQGQLKALRDSVGDFVGVSEAIRRIGKAAGGLNNLELSKLVEELGGIRQVGKIIPALRNVDKAIEATNIGIEGVGSVANDATIAVQTLEVRLSKLSESFKNVTDSFFQSDTLKGLTSGILSVAEGLVAAADAAKPLLPLLTTIVGTSLTKAGFSFFKGFKKEFSNATGGISGSVGSKLGSSLSSSSSSSSKATTRVDPALLNATRDNTKALKELTVALRDCCNGKKGPSGGGDSQDGPSGGSGGKSGPKGGGGGPTRGGTGVRPDGILNATLVDPRLPPLPKGTKEYNLNPRNVSSLPPAKGDFTQKKTIKERDAFGKETTRVVEVVQPINKLQKSLDSLGATILQDAKRNKRERSNNRLGKFLDKEIASVSPLQGPTAKGNILRGGALASTATTQGLDNFITQGDAGATVTNRLKGFKGTQQLSPLSTRLPFKQTGRQTPEEQKSFLERRGEGDRIVTVEVAGGKLDEVDITGGGIRGGDPSFGPVPAKPRGRDIPGSFGAAFGKTKNKFISQEEFRTTETKQFSPFAGSSAKALGNVGKGKAIGANANSIIVANKELTNLNATLKGTDTVTVNTEKALERARGANGRFVGGLEGLKGTFVQLESTVQKSQAVLGDASADIISKDTGGRSRAPAGTTLASGKKIGGQLLPQDKLAATFNPTIDKAAALTAEFTSKVDLTTTAFDENNQAVDKNITEHELLEKALRTYRQSMDKVTTSAEEAARQLRNIAAAKASPDARSILSKAPRSGKGPSKFANGGFVDGPSHSQGGVPAELEGGEFVVPKAQVDQKKKLPKFAAGDLFKEGEVNPQNKDKIKIQDALVNGIAFIQGPRDSRNKDKTTGGNVAVEGLTLTGKAGKDAGLKNVSKALKNLGYPIEEKGIPSDTKDGVKAFGPYGKYTLNPPNTEDLDEKGINKLFREDAPQAALEAGFKVAFERIASSVDSSLLKGAVPTFDDLSDENKTRFKEETYASMKGFMTEAFAAGLSGASLAKSGANFDIEGVTSEQLEKLSLYYDGGNKSTKAGSNAPPLAGSPAKFIEAKATQKQIENAAPKLTKGYADGQLKGSYTAFAKGGLTGEANSLLMPGELVFPPDLVAKVGIEKLREFNKNGDPSVLGNVSGKGIGTVPGTGNTDNFPADLESGSFVVKKSSSKKSGLQKFARGGLTGTSISGVERTGSGKRVVRDAEGEIVSFGSALAGLTESALSVGVVFNSLSSIDFSSTQGLATAIPTIAFGFNSLKPIISQAGPLLKGLGREFGLISEQTQKSNEGLDDFTKALNQASTRLYDTGSAEDFFDNFKRNTKIGGKDFDVSPRQQRSIERVNRAQERKKLTRQQRINRVNRQRGLRLKDPLAEGRVGRRKGLTSKSFLTKGFGLGAGFQDASLGKAGFNFGTFAQKAFSRGLKGGAIGAGIGAAISTGIEKAEFFGSSREIAGVKGLTSGSVEDAGLQGAIQGATQFGSTLAGIGSAFGPFGTAIGGATGAVIGWTKGLLDAEEEQKKFNIFKGIEDDSKGFQLALDELAAAIADKKGAAAINESISQVGKRSKELAGQVGIAAAALEDFNIDTDKTATASSIDILKDFFTGEFSQAASGLNKKLNNIASITTLDPRGTFRGLAEAIGENSLLGPIRDFIDKQSGRETTRSEDTRTLVSNVQNFDNLVQALGVLDSESLKQAEDQLFKSIPDIIAKSITDQQGLENQEEAIKRLEALDKALINSTGFDDTIEAIEKFNKEAEDLGEELVIDKKLIESLKGIQKSSQQQGIKEFAESIEKLKDAKKIKAQIGDPLVELAKELSKPDSNVENAAEKFKQEFLEAINLKSLSRQGLNFETEEGLINVEDFFNTRDIEESLKFLKESISIDKEKELGPEKFKLNLEIIGKLFGGSADNASVLVKELLDLFESLDQGNASAISAATAQTLLNLATEKSVEGIRVFTSALNELSNSVSSNVEKLGVAASNIQAEVERILSGSSEVRPDERFNPFASPGASNKDILAGADRLKFAFGGLDSLLGEGGFQGLGAASIFSGDLSKILKDTANQVRGELAQSKASTLGENQILDAFKDNAGDIFSKLPSEIQKRFLDRLQETFRGSRQEKGAGPQELLEQLVQFGDGAGLDEFGEEVKAALADLTNSLNQFETLVVQSANIALEAAKKEADTKSKLLNREISLQRRLDKFTNSSINKRQRAEDNLRANLENTASVGGTVGLGNTDVLDARSLAKRQERLEAERDRLRKQIGLGDDATPGQIEKATRGANQPLIKQLGENAAALEGNRKALEALGEDVTRLEAVESELSKIQESRLDQRQRAKLFADRISSAKTPQDQVKVFNEFLKPVIAASKAAQGVALNFGEAASIIGDPKIIKDALGLNDQQLEKLLASATGGIGGAFGRLFGRLGGNFNLGGQLGGRLFGTGATELGTTQKEIELKKQLIDLDSDSRKAILETNKLIQAALLETQEKFADKVSDTAQALDEAGDKFDELTEKLKVLVPQLQAGGNLPTRQTGGRITGPSHSNGGVDIEAEGGEFIIRKSATSKLQKQMPGLLESLNKGKIPRKMPDGGPTDEEEFDFRRRLSTPTRPKPKRRPSTPNTSPKTPRTELDRNPIGTVNNAPTLSGLKSFVNDFSSVLKGNLSKEELIKNNERQAKDFVIDKAKSSGNKIDIKEFNVDKLGNMDLKPQGAGRLVGEELAQFNPSTEVTNLNKIRVPSTPSTLNAEANALESVPTALDTALDTAIQQLAPQPALGLQRASGARASLEKRASSNLNFIGNEILTGVPAGFKGTAALLNSGFTDPDTGPRQRNVTGADAPKLEDYSQTQQFIGKGVAELFEGGRSPTLGSGLARGLDDFGDLIQGNPLGFSADQRKFRDAQFENDRLGEAKGANFKRVIQDISLGSKFGVGETSFKGGLGPSIRQIEAENQDARFLDEQRQSTQNLTAKNESFRDRFKTFADRFEKSGKLKRGKDELGFPTYDVGGFSDEELQKLVEGKDPSRGGFTTNPQGGTDFFLSGPAKDELAKRRRLPESGPGSLEDSRNKLKAIKDTSSKPSLDRDPDPRFSEDTLAKERENLDAFIRGDITEEQFESTRALAQRGAVAAGSASGVNTLEAEQQVRTDTTKKPPEPTAPPKERPNNLINVEPKRSAEQQKKVDQARARREAELKARQDAASRGEVGAFYSTRERRNAGEFDPPEPTAPLAGAEQQVGADTTKKSGLNQPQSRELDILDQINAFEEQQGETFMGSSSSPELLNFLADKEGFEGISSGDRDAQREINKVIKDRYRRRQYKGAGDNTELYKQVDKDIRAEALIPPPVPEKPVGPVQPDRLSPAEERPNNLINVQPDRPAERQKRVDQARARRKAEIEERKAAALRGVRGAYYRQKDGTLPSQLQPTGDRGQNQPTGRGSIGNPLLDKFDQGGAGGTSLPNQLQNTTLPNNFTGSGVGDAQRAKALRQSLSSGGADGIARPGQFSSQDLSSGGADGVARPGQLPSQDLSRGGADGIALANQTPPTNLTQLEGNRNARAQAGGATIENNQQFVTVAQELTTASQQFSQSIANSVQLLNESPFIQQLTKASEVLSSLPEMKITLNAQVKPVEVILNGGALIAQMKEEAKAEILQAVGEKIANLTNPDGSIRNDSLS